ncbi:MAG: class I SAM-dependent DNA methyltransferase, partial [Leptolyngbya sp. RL_3_1]|nr:class I SAM-dependent DNA methyltransferase [Leptolyngbya sp. RL_3_1]
MGIELNPRAAAIAELVIWIGYLQWYFKRYGNAEPPEPVLQAFGNIECRDAVLAYDGREPDVDPKTGQVRTRWGGRMMTSPVTGEEVPDPEDQVVIYRYLNPRPAEWPEADYVVSNPPFVGNRRMREALGDGYAESVRENYEAVPETVDYVFYWWHQAAELTRSVNHKLQRFGLITTDTIRQTWQRKLLEFHLNHKTPLRIFFAVSDHPWSDDGAAVRIAMTGAEAVNKSENILPLSMLGNVTSEAEASTPEDEADYVNVRWERVGRIYSNLRAGVDLGSAVRLQSNKELCCPGIKLHGIGFVLSEGEAKEIEEEVVFPYLNGRDFTQTSRKAKVIDLFGLSEEEVLQKYPHAYQWVYNRVKPDRDQNNRASYREKWWIFGEPRASFRPALSGLPRYIGTPQTSKHRAFAFISGKVVPDQQIIVIASEDAYLLGVLSSNIHICWALSAGGRLEDRPRYNNSVCFDPFPFPDPTPEQKQKIRDLGDRLDAHRKQVQATHPDITITGMYNLLEKLRAGEPFTDKDRDYNNRALVSTLKQIHDDLDTAVLDAYGWQDLIPLLSPSPTGRGARVRL